MTEWRTDFEGNLRVLGSNLVMKGGNRATCDVYGFL